MGVARTGPERREPSDDGAAPRPQTQRPARQRPSSHDGSYSFIRAGRISPSQAEAAASNPSSWPSRASRLPGPSARPSGSTRCQARRKRRKSACETGSISRRSRSRV